MGSLRPIFFHMRYAIVLTCAMLPGGFGVGARVCTHLLHTWSPLLPAFPRATQFPLLTLHPRCQEPERT